LRARKWASAAIALSSPCLHQGALAMRWIIAGGLFAASLAASAQQSAPPFAAPNLSDNCVHSMAAACAMCHGMDGKPARGSIVNALAGRPKDEIVSIMGQFKANARPATVMHQIARGYSDAEIEALTAYFSRQKR